MMKFESDCLILLVVILLLCGDVEHNPGPKTRYSYSICYLPVRCNQKALLCDFCELWCHCKCSGAKNEAYSFINELIILLGIVHAVLLVVCHFMTSFLTFKDSMVTCFSDDQFSDVSSFAQPNNGLHIAHLNCWSFLSHKDEIVQLICISHLDVLTLSKIWLDDIIPDVEFFLWDLITYCIVKIETIMVVVWLLWYQIVSPIGPD